MDASTFLKEEPSEQGLQAVHKQWALWATRRFRFSHPELDLALYGAGWDFMLHVRNCKEDAFPALEEYFDLHIRPMTCNIRLSRQAPKLGVQIQPVKCSGERIEWLLVESMAACQPNPIMKYYEAAAE